MFYQLEVKQIVDYPRCRIYRDFLRNLMDDTDIRTNGNSYLFYYMILCSYANFRTSYRKLEGISYLVTPGEWICTTAELSEWFRTSSGGTPGNGTSPDFPSPSISACLQALTVNLINPENSDSWNCLAEIEGQEIMAQLFSDVIIKNTGSTKGDHFWDNAEMNLLKALVLYVDQGFPPESKNIGQVYKLLTMNSEKELNSLFDMLPVTHPAKAPYNIFKQASDTVRSGVIIGLGTRLQVFQNKLIRQITSYNEINLTQPGKEKCAYFCITSDQDSTFDFLSSLFMSFVFIKLVRYADKYGDCGRLPVPVHILADELANGGCTIADLTKKISTIRSRALSISCIFQNLPQMQNRYPDNQWQEIIGNCDTQLFLGCTDEMTAEFISNRTGEVSVAVSSEAKQLNTWRVSDYTPEYRETHSIGKRKLMTPDEVLRLPLDQALIILRGQKVLKVGKYDYTLHPESKRLTPSRASDHVPEWRKKPETDEPDFTNLMKPKKPKKPKAPKKM